MPMNISGPPWVVDIPPTPIQALVSGAGIPWASRPSAVTAGNGAFQWISDVGAGGAATLWRSDGALWRLAFPQELYMDFTNSTGAVSVSEQIIKQWVGIPAGVLSSLRYFSIKVLWAKSGTTDAVTTLRFRLGTAGTVADASLVSSASMTSGNRSFATETPVFPSSDTQLRLVGTQNLTAAWAGAGSTLAYPQNLTVPSMSTLALTLSASMTMAGTTDTPSIPHMIVSGY